jgi:hypothetical protein
MYATKALDAPSWLQRSRIVAAITSVRISHEHHDSQTDWRPFFKHVADEVLREAFANASRR